MKVLKMKTNKLKWILYTGMMIPIIPVSIDTIYAIDPYDEGLEHTGLFMVIALSIALLAGPIGRLLKKPKLWILKQPMGLAAFTWSLVHILVYLYYNQSILYVAALDILIKPSIATGAIAFIILLKLALTSFSGAVRLLGKRWNVLHSSVVIAATLAVGHGLGFQKTTTTDGAIVSLSLLLVILMRYFFEFVRAKR